MGNGNPVRMYLAALAAVCAMAASPVFARGTNAAAARQQDHLPGEIIVKLKSELSVSAAQLNQQLASSLQLSSARHHIEASSRGKRCLVAAAAAAFAFASSRARARRTAVAAACVRPVAQSSSASVRWALAQQTIRAVFSAATTAARASSSPRSCSPTCAARSARAV